MGEPRACAYNLVLQFQFASIYNYVYVQLCMHATVHTRTRTHTPIARIICFVTGGKLIALKMLAVCKALRAVLQNEVFCIV